MPSYDEPRLAEGMRLLWTIAVLLTPPRVKVPLDPLNGKLLPELMPPLSPDTISTNISNPLPPVNNCQVYGVTATISPVSSL